MTNFLVNWTANLKLAIEIELLIKANRYRLYNVQCFVCRVIIHVTAKYVIQHLKRNILS